MKRRLIEAFDDGNISVTTQALVPGHKITGDARKKALAQNDPNFWQRIDRVIVRPGKAVHATVADLFQPLGMNDIVALENNAVAAAGRELAAKAVAAAEHFDARAVIAPRKQVRVVLEYY